MDLKYTLHRERPVWLHGYVLPFFFAYLLLGYLYLHHVAPLEAQPEAKGEVEAEAEATPQDPQPRAFGSMDLLIISAALVALLNFLCFFATYWNVSFRAWMTLFKAESLDKATLIKVHPEEHRGASEICPIHRTEGVTWFMFQKRKFMFEPEKKGFKTIEYPVQEPFSFYASSRGLESLKKVEEAKDKWGDNTLEIPMPTFGELFKEHAVAPFFIFQLFCVGLWCLDEYWYYSIFTLVMLLLFEATVVFQRLRNMKELRNMSPKAYEIYVYRQKAWVKISTAEILPSDLISLARSKDDVAVPCDILLLEGSCIVNEAMLTGESTPQLKESIQGRSQGDPLNMNTDKIHIIFSGTKVVQNAAPKTSDIPPAPDHGCLGYVLKTGFETSQGELVRTIIFSTERVTANSLEALFFILFLLMFAIAASSYVWTQGIRRGRSRYQLVLDCILILTSVIPPELPMELSLAVNQSLIALFKFAIFCTEPFRIPYAGKVDICCFDKTGTLTSEQLVLKGVVGLDIKNLHQIKAPTELPSNTNYVLATCHALMVLEEGLVGDPMEKAALEAIRWNLSNDEVATPKSGGVQLKLLKRFPFSSALKRMATVSRISGGSESGLFVSVKGAPETLHDMFEQAPEFYSSVHKEFARTGSRVLALGYKRLSGQKADGLTRDEVESGLIFAGFLIFSSPLKEDAVSALNTLKDSSHRNVMITGDSPLTACHIAKEVSIMQKPALILDSKDEIEFPTTVQELEWKTVDESQVFPLELSRDKIMTLVGQFHICLTGRALDIVTGRREIFDALLPHVRVYARTSPEQKEYVVTQMKKQGFITLMCGDGTNDVGALKQAHVGIALLDGKPEDLVKIAQAKQRAAQRKREEQMAELKRRLEDARNPNLTPAERNRRSREHSMAAARAAMDGMEDEVPIIKLGDASIAAPFTSKISHVTSVCHVIRQGRSALVTTIQMYKILALNCLITAYSLSVLYLDGIKFGDMQMTVSGVLMSICFLAVSKNTTLDKLSQKRPQPNIFNFYILLSVIGQFAIHVYSLFTITSLSKRLMNIDEDGVVDLEKKFEPSLLNGGVYLISLAMHVSTFAINYQGRPFRESITENKPLFYSLMAVMMICVAAASDSSDEIRTLMELVPFPQEFRDTLLRLIFFDLAGCFVVEKITAFLFSDNRPKAILRGG